MLYLKIHENEHGAVLAMCDKELIGKVLQEGSLYIDLKQFSEFYEGKLVDIKTAVSIILKVQAYSVNAIGKESVEAAIEGKLVKKENTSSVNGVPYAQAYKVDY